MNSRVITLSFTLLAILALASCASVNEPSSKPETRTRPSAAPAAPAEIQMEGGIVGTGNENECKNSDNKITCNDNVK
jgi:hypothetical protein